MMMNSTSTTSSLPTPPISGEELASFLQDQYGISYDPKYKSFDKDPLEAITDIYMKRGIRTGFVDPWYHYVEREPTKEDTCPILDWERAPIIAAANNPKAPDECDVFGLKKLPPMPAGPFLEATYHGQDVRTTLFQIPNAFTTSPTPGMWNLRLPGDHIRTFSRGVDPAPNVLKWVRISLVDGRSFGFKDLQPISIDNIPAFDLQGALAQAVAANTAPKPGRHERKQGRCEVGDMCQGGIGNCGIVSMTGGTQSLATQPLKQVINPTSSSPIGCYTFRVFQNGLIRWMVIDDLIPIVREVRMKQGGKLEPWSMRCSGHVKYWPLLIEKHMSKLFGGYDVWNANTKERSDTHWQRRCYDWGPEVFQVDELKMLINPNHWEHLCTHLGVNAIGDFAWGAPNDLVKQANLVPGHGYAALAARSVGGRHFIKCRNPWGSQDWNGDWCWSSPLWDQYPEIAKVLLPLNPPGENSFWMERKDFLKYAGSKGAGFHCHYNAGPGSGFTMESLPGGLIRPDHHESRLQSPAVVLNLVEPAPTVLFHAECNDHRRRPIDPATGCSRRLFTEVYRLNAQGKISEQAVTIHPPFYSTQGKGSWCPEVLQHEMNNLAAGKYLFVIRSNERICSPTGEGMFFRVAVDQAMFSLSSKWSTLADHHIDHSLPSPSSIEEQYDPSGGSGTTSGRSGPPFRAKYHMVDNPARYQDFTAYCQGLAEEFSPEEGVCLLEGGLNQALGGDPFPGYRKAFTVEFTDGRPTQSWPESEKRISFHTGCVRPKLPNSTYASAPSPPQQTKPVVTAAVHTPNQQGRGRFRACYRVVGAEGLGGGSSSLSKDVTQEVLKMSRDGICQLTGPGQGVNSVLGDPFPNKLKEFVVDHGDGSPYQIWPEVVPAGISFRTEK